MGLIVLSSRTAAEESGSGAILVEDWSDWRDANNGLQKFFDAYNGNVGDAGPSQTVTGVNSNRLVASVPSANIWYIHALSPPYTDPSDWFHQHIESGETWDVDANRVVTGFVTDAESSDAAPSDNFNIGTYEKELDDFTSSYAGRHFYHGVGTPITANRPIKIFITSRPDHEVGAGGGVNYSPRDQYFTKWTRHYITHWGPYYDDPGANPPATYYLFPYYAWNQDDIVVEDDTYIGLTALQYDGSKYVLRFASISNTSLTFDIRYTTDGESVRSKGFTNATDGGTAANSGDAYKSVGWDSGAMSESTNGFYVAARRQGQTTLFTEWYLPYNFSQTNMGVP